MNKFSNSWKLFKAALSVLAADRELLIFPILSSIGVFLITLSFALPLFLSNIFDAIFSKDMGLVGLAVTFLFYLVQYTVVFYANTALVGAAMIRLQGGDPTVKDGFAIANRCLGSIFGYALIAATVGMILKALSQRKDIGRLIGSVAGMAWSLATYLVVPVLAAEGVGPIEAIKKSAGLLKKTWGEQIIGNFGLGMVFGLASILLVIVAIPAFVLAAKAQSLLLILIMVGILFLLFTLMGLLNSSLNGIYTAAVYRYAANGETSGFFEEKMVTQAFLQK